MMIGLLLLQAFTIAFNIQSSRLALAQTNELTDPKELETFLDGVINAELRAYYIPGATVAVVKDGQLFFSKGYGYADIDKGRLVVANQTLFRIASVSKLFTWTAVMQLFEQGKLDLTADVNAYLEAFKIPDTYAQPITLVHLMTHTAGFEDQLIGGSAQSAADILPLGEYLARNIPARVRPPRELSAYSNFGAALAGYIVEQVSGMSFDEYIEQKIFAPLNMHNSTFRQPPPSDLNVDVSVGYTYANGIYHAGAFEYGQLPPAGSMSTTATDIAKFMIAHLQNGRYENSRILQNTTGEQMHSHLFTHDPKVNGWAYGFAELNLNDHRMISHGGDLQLFHTSLVLLPEHNLGLFVSYNSPGGIRARSELLKAFFDRYCPVPTQVAPKPSADFSQRASRFTGSYRMTRSAYTTLAKTNKLFAQVEVTATPDGTLLVTGLGDPMRWVEVEPLVFRPAGGQPSTLYNSLVFREDKEGQITHFFLMNMVSTAFERVPWYETTSFTYGLLGICTALFISMIMFLPVRFLIDRRKGKAKTPSSIWARLGRWLAGGFSLLNVLSVVGYLIATSNPNLSVYGIPSFVVGLLSIVLVASAFAITSFAFAVLAWKQRYWSFAGRVHYTIVTLAALAFIWLLNNWNLLGFKF